MEAFALAELERIAANMIRVGVVHQLDEANARVTVDLGEIVSDWLPWVTSRAGATRTWSAPRPGEQVLVLAPYGDPAQAIVLPAIYQDEYPAPAASRHVDSATFEDGSTVSYDSRSHVLTLAAGSARVIVTCQQATINADSVTLNSPQTTCTGALTVQGMLTYQAGMTGVGASVITGNLAVAGGLTNDGVSVGAGHTHSGVERGDKTSGPPI